MTDVMRTRRSRQRATAPTTCDPVELSSEQTSVERPPETLEALELALSAARKEAALEAPARDVLTRNARLLEEQIGLARNERFRARIKAVRDLAIAATVILLLAAVGAMVWSARQANEVVLQAFVVPPDMIAEGLTGEAVAGELLDRMAAIQTKAETGTIFTQAEARGEGETIHVEIPQTGVSMGEVERYLRHRLGRQTMVSGVLRRRGDRLLLTVRSSGSPGRTFEGPEADLPALLQSAAEAVLQDTQPLRMASYLASEERMEEAEALVRPLLGRGTDKERAQAYLAMSVLLLNSERAREALSAARLAVQLNPFDGASLAFVGASEWTLGQHEAALASIASARAAFRRPAGGDGLSQIARATGEPAMLSYARQLTRDHAGSVEASEDAAVISARGGDDSGMQSYRWAAASQAALGRDLPEARRLAADLPRTDATLLVRNLLEMETAAALEDWPRALSASLAMPNADSPEFVAMDARYLALSGRVAEAAELAAGMPNDCYPCLIVRGKLAARSGDPAAADRWFAEAVRQGPSLPSAHSAWGEARLARGDLPGAIRMFREAHERGPRWADPLKFDGDALALQGDHRTALRRYEAALDRAPRWGAAHLAAGRSLAALRRPQQATESYRRALRLDLSAADRAEASRLVARQPARP
jgi:tetratricopeptide (TPR) repeat protein